MLICVKICRMTGCPMNLCDHGSEISFTVARNFTRTRARANPPVHHNGQLYITNKPNHSFVGKAIETERES